MTKSTLYTHIVSVAFSDEQMERIDALRKKLSESMAVPGVVEIPRAPLIREAIMQGIEIFERKLESSGHNYS